MQILHGEDKGLLLTAGEEQLLNSLERPGLAGLSAERRKLVGRDRHTQQGEEIRQAGVGIEVRLLEARAHPGYERLWAIIRGDPAVIPQQLQDGQIGRHTPVRQALPCRIPDALASDGLAKFVQQS